MIEDVAIDFSDLTNGNPEGDGYFDVMMRSIKAHIQLEYNANRIKGTEYATVYLGALQYAMQMSQQFVLSAKLQEAQAEEVLDSTSRANTELQDKLLSTAKQREKIDVEIDLAGAQKLLIEEQTDKVTEEIALIGVDTLVKEEQWGIQKEIMGHQLSMITVDDLNKATIVAKDIATKQAQIEQIEADTDFSVRKADTMENTREDNVRMQAAREYGEYLKYISAAGVVPSSLHFDNLVGLIDAMASKTDGDVLTKKEVLDAAIAADGTNTKGIDIKGPYLTKEPIVYKEYFYVSTIGVTVTQCWRVGNVTCTDKESGEACK